MQLKKLNVLNYFIFTDLQSQGVNAPLNRSHVMTKVVKIIQENIPEVNNIYIPHPHNRKQAKIK